ncbi:chromosome segregation protein SMC [Flavilitoribacter nigricans]|uniref:Chromosome partition protein Smc n=1 Tax=Flavilitoribacter nigricans (strain ATCC 23147 / DSM 23189 / NBRC 102662 / NCIMB 1420 / SS-2) TaxID=1122177 RepID=A0A2D0NCZ6_FLAN2|nr:chromosome segregation protein SMC [Flavilitoribacter nigricans]PHN05643.1 chromosome segregation protein SMC [Flavilitoribacter nigricans DSM 23189 = NBRC 102662]
MRLQRLEIKGFKSFANETVINFDADVIGIVGPNGSGKSNIVDAIRWVLGEQKSRELRLDQMSSVIFNGTKKRKPSGVASVSLTFENTKNLLPVEYQSVTITRMLYRSGESEYRLNGVTCRLKDITSLFLDTGIGSNSYAIIALGMVDDILADKDNSRRKMFEQAAGISKYKLRKRETLNKLKNTTEDLDRVEDLLYEIDQNLKTLEKQARRARKFFELKAQYKEMSVNLAVIKINALRDKQRDMAKKLNEEQDKYRNFDVKSNQLEARLEEERKANLDKEKALSDRQRELNDLIGQIRSLENDKRMQDQRLQFIEQNKGKLSSDIQQARTRIQQLEEDIEHYQTELNTEKRIESRLELELEQAEDALQKIRENHGSVKADLEEVVNRQQAVERELFEFEKEKAVYSNRIETYRQEIERSRLDIEMRTGEVSGLREKIRGIEEQVQAKKSEVETLEKAEEKRQTDISQAEEQLEEINQKRSRVNRQLDAKRNEFKLTQSMIENLEGFPESIRFLSGNKDWKQNAPLLSDLIYVQENYRIAIENYLEPYLNYYVVENLEEAYAAIQLLSRSQKGKANFFLLDAFRDYSAPIALLPGATQAIDLVETEPKYYNLFSYLLEHVLVTDQEDLKQPVGEQTTLLSSSGRFIKRKYSISGGSVGLFEGKKIGRKKNLEVLEKAIQKAEREENRLSTEYFSLRKKLEELRAKKTNAQIQHERQQLNQLEQQRISLATRLENFESFILEVSTKIEESEGQIGELEKSIRDIEEQLAEKMDVISGIKDQIHNTDSSFREIAEQLSQASTDYNDKNIAFIRQQNKVGAFQRELNYREKQLEETRQTLARNQETLAKSDGEVREIQDALDQQEVKLREAYESRKVMEETLTEAEQIYYKARGGINEIEDELRKITRQRQDAQILINQLKEKYNDVKFEVTSVAQRLRIEFSIEINEVLNQEREPETLPLEELELKVDRIRGRLDNYGEINPMAVEAYDEMKERFDTISQQRDDILQAKESLIETIKEIEDTATNQFLDSFEKARGYFIDVFRSLFTEDDNCDLILLEPENPLESKIEIVAKPKGKRPQTISQLSGGEKTLTATALLFALYLLKPAPFCIFDEVDAPLDDANINKFNRIIKKFSRDSQFIIVTHNKLTMAAVDTIYGVFMASQGVSGVSPVDFRDFEHKATFEVSAN